MPLHFELVTPARLVRSEDVYMVVVPGTEGEFGVLEGHAPVMATIRDGAVKVYRTEGTGIEQLRPIGTIPLTPVQLVTATNYRDTGVQHGISYYYEVVSVDKTGNESARVKTDWVLVPKTP